MEEAEGYRTLIEGYGLSQTAAAARVGRSRPAVANALRLLALPEEVRALVRDGKLSAGHARALLTVEGDKNRVAAARTVMRRDMSVRQAERFCRRFGKDAPEKPAGEIDYAKDLAVRLSERFGRKVSVTCRRGRGAVMLHYHSLDDLDVLLARLEGNGEKK
jgi:ParB family chromosome partitioning protein